MSVFIGTAGWSIAARYAADFLPHGTHLERYAQVLNAVEINSSFYRPHQRKTYERWAHSVPEDFRFAVKLPRSITHEARLAEYDSPLGQFLEEIAGLGRKLGAILVQLPPSLAYDPQIAEEFFEKLRSASLAAIACEPRHASWFTPQAETMLMRHHIARVAADPAPVSGEAGGWPGLVYIRLHGSPRIYYSNYCADFLSDLLSRIANHHAAGRVVWCIFDNTAEFAALGNALTLNRAYAALEGVSSTAAGAGADGVSAALSSERNSASTRMLSR